MSDPKNKGKKRLSPEQAYFSKLKGKGVKVEFREIDDEGGQTCEGELLWVDQYTICVRVPSIVPEEVPGTDFLIYKHSIQKMRGSHTEASPAGQ